MKIALERGIVVAEVTVDGPSIRTAARSKPPWAPPPGAGGHVGPSILQCPRLVHRLPLLQSPQAPTFLELPIVDVGTVNPEALVAAPVDMATPLPPPTRRPQKNALGVVGNGVNSPSMPLQRHWPDPLRLCCPLPPNIDLSRNHNLVLNSSHNLVLRSSHSLVLNSSPSVVLNSSHNLVLSSSCSLDLSFSHNRSPIHSLSSHTPKLCKAKPP